MNRECEIVQILGRRVAGGDATPGERTQVEAHLKVCSECGKGRVAGMLARLTPATKSKRPSQRRETSRNAVGSIAPSGAKSPGPGLPIKRLTAVGVVIAVAGVVMWLKSSPNAADTGAATESESLMAIPQPAPPIEPGGAMALVEPENQPVPAETTEPAPQLEVEPAVVESPEPSPATSVAIIQEPVGAPQEPPAVEPQPAPAIGNASATLDASNCADLEKSSAKEGLTSELQAAALSSTGRCWQAAGNNKAALRLFERVITDHAGTASVPAAMFEKGVVCEALGRPGTAAAAYATYRREFPTAPRMGEALYNLCRIHVAAGRRDQALVCLKKYRLRFAHEEHFATVHFFEGLVLKDNPESLLAAAESFESYAAGDDTEHLDDALYWRAATLRQAKDDRQTAAAQAYLKRMASGKHATEVRGWLD